MFTLTFHWLHTSNICSQIFRNSSFSFPFKQASADEAPAQIQIFLDTAVQSVVPEDHSAFSSVNLDESFAFRIDRVY